MTMEAIAITGSFVALAMTGSAFVIAHFEEKKPRLGRDIVITIDDPVEGLIRTVVRSTRRADLILADVERAIREGTSHRERVRLRGHEGADRQ